MVVARQGRIYGGEIGVITSPQAWFRVNFCVKLWIFPEILQNFPESSSPQIIYPPPQIFFRSAIDCREEWQFRQFNNTTESDYHVDIWASANSGTCSIVKPAECMWKWFPRLAVGLFCGCLSRLWGCRLLVYMTFTVISIFT